MRADNDVQLAPWGWAWSPGRAEAWRQAQRGLVGSVVWQKRESMLPHIIGLSPLSLI